MDEFFLRELLDTRYRSLGKYSRNIRAYSNTAAGGQILALRSAPVQGLVQAEVSVETDTAPTSQMSVIRSVIDTLVSKIASTKVRPFFTPIAGGYKTVKILKQAQIFFDDLYDKADVVKKITMAFRDACIFDTGCIFINPFDYSIMKINPHQATILDTEYHYGKMTKALVSFEDVPRTILKEVYGLDWDTDYANTLDMYFDTQKKKIYLLTNYGSKKIKEVSYSAPIPLVLLHYSIPIRGAKTVSLVDDLYSLQWNINIINARIKEAATLTPANLLLAPVGTALDIQQLDNRAGQILQYRPLEGVGNPIDVVTPAFINPSYQQYLEYLIQKAYEMSGISTLSAQAVNPLGANASGAALQSMENIESTRFESQLNQVVRAYVDLAKLLIDVLPEDVELLPAENTRAGITWKDLKKEASFIHIQYSAQTMLSKDPSTRLNQIMQLSQAGVIPQGRLGQFLEMPDITEVFNIMSSAQDGVDKVIQLALENEVYTIPEFVSYQLLGENITTLQNQIYSNLDVKNPDSLQELQRLSLLEQLLEQRIQEEGFIPLEEGELQVSEGGIGAAGIVEAPSAMAMGIPPETANDKNQWGEV